MPDWTVFGAVTVLLTVLVLVFSRATQSMLATEDDELGPAETSDERASATDPEPIASLPPEHPDAEPSGQHVIEESNQRPPEASPEKPDQRPPEARQCTVPETEPGETDASLDQPSLSDLSTSELLANVAITHGLFAAVVVGAAVWTGIPAAALGIEPTPISVSYPAIAYGLALGVALYIANELIAANLDSVGVEYSEALRSSLAPDSVGGWIVLFVGVLPLIAVFEELLFRAALIGAFAAGFGISPWIMVVVSSVAFALGHGIQGPGGVLVTGLLGGVLGVAFVLTNSLLLVVIAHYVVNALEFGVHEGLGIDAKRWLSVT